jgi:serine/threonine protein kinase
MSLQPGEVFAGYTVERKLGAGGMGSVYLVRHPRLPRHDALKLLRAELCDDAAFVGRFEREADTVAQLDHPNIVAVHDRGSEGGQLWISMRFVDGTTAEDALADYQKGMPADRAVRIVSKVSSALDYAHRHDLLHRDVKPANILLAAGTDVDEGEMVFLSDFGVAKAIGGSVDQAASLTSTGSVVATLGYASPEQIQGHRLDHRADIYALGCVLYELLTGSVPYPAGSVAALIYAHLYAPPPRPTVRVPSLERAFDDVVAKAMATDPDDRYFSCRALAVAAQQALSAPSAGSHRRGWPDQGSPIIVTTAPEATAYPLPVHGEPQPVAGLPGTRPEEIPPSVPAANGESVATSGSAAEQRTGEHRPSTPPRDHPPSTWLGPDHPRGEENTSDRNAGENSTVPASSAQPIGASGTSPDGSVGSPSSDAAARGDGPRRILLIVGAVGLVAVTGVVAAFFLRGGVDGNAAMDNTSKTAAASSRTVGSTGPASTPFRAPSSGASSTPTSNTSGPVPGLPHSTPLGHQILLGTRAVDGSTELYQIDADSGAVGQRLTRGAPGPQYPVLSPDRGSIIYAQAGTLRTSAVDGTGDKPLFTGPIDDCATYARPAWNPMDQTELAMLCTTTDKTVRLYRIGVDGRIRGTIDTAGFLLVDDIAYAPDGKAVAFWASATPRTGGSIYVQPTGGGPPVRVTDRTNTDAGPMFSPDGTHIVFSRMGPDGKNSQIFLVTVDGTQLTPLTDGASVDQNPSFSPDGRQIVFNRSRLNEAGTRDTQSWIMRADGSELHQIAVDGPGTADGAPAWGAR